MATLKAVVALKDAAALECADADVAAVVADVADAVGASAGTGSAL